MTRPSTNPETKRTDREEASSFGPVGGYLPHSIAAFGPGVRPDEKSWKLQAGTYRAILGIARLADLRWLSAARPWFDRIRVERHQWR